MDKATARQRIEEIDAILAEGVSSVSSGDKSVSYDLPALRRERDRLQASLNRGPGQRGVRVGRYNSAWRD